MFLSNSQKREQLRVFPKSVNLFLYSMDDPVWESICLSTKKIKWLWFGLACDVKNWEQLIYSSYYFRKANLILIWKEFEKKLAVAYLKFCGDD